MKKQINNAVIGGHQPTWNVRRNRILLMHDLNTHEVTTKGLAMEHWVRCEFTRVSKQSLGKTLQYAAVS
jgi:hypothetical protein